MAFNIKKIFSYDGDDDNLNGTEDEYYTTSEAEAIKEADKSGNKMILLEPRAFSESQQIADHLKNRNSVVVNLKRCKKLGLGYTYVPQRMLMFKEKLVMKQKKTPRIILMMKN